VLIIVHAFPKSAFRAFPPIKTSAFLNHCEKSPAPLLYKVEPGVSFRVNFIKTSPPVLEMATGLTLLLNIILILTLVTAAALARPFSEDQFLRTFADEQPRIVAAAEGPVIYSNFDNGTGSPLYRRSGIKRQMQGLFKCGFINTDVFSLLRTSLEHGQAKGNENASGNDKLQTILTRVPSTSLFAGISLKLCKKNSKDSVFC
jgi:hypothetical protein